jgi:hypothetical protein
LDFLAWLRRLFGLDGKPDPPPPTDPCLAPACVNAKNKLDGARNGFNNVCSGLRSLTSVLKLLSQMLVVPIWILALLIVVAILVGGLVAVIIWALVGLYLFAWFLSLVVGQMIAVLTPILSQRAMEFAAAVPDVVANCPANCRGDLSAPSCPL